MKHNDHAKPDITDDESEDTRESTVSSDIQEDNFVHK